MKEIVIQSSNIKCNGCVNNIQKGLCVLSGVDAVDVDIDTNKVTIRGESLDKNQISSVLTDLGYPEV